MKGTEYYEYSSIFHFIGNLIETVYYSCFCAACEERWLCDEITNASDKLQSARMELYQQEQRAGLFIAGGGAIPKGAGGWCSSPASFQ